jgi:muconolactone D-isomerase
MLRRVQGCASHLQATRSWRRDPVAPHDGCMTREFIVEITTTIPDRTDPSEVEERRAEEAVRAKEFAASGHLARLWRPVGELRSIGLWRAEDEADLYANVLDTLPLRPWMAITVTEVQPHPNDPGR